MLYMVAVVQMVDDIQYNQSRKETLIVDKSIEITSETSSYGILNIDIQLELDFSIFFLYLILRLEFVSLIQIFWF
jgi:hypothetical protein